MTAKKNRVHVTLLIDETGSMEPYRAQTISGFNEYIQGLKADTKSIYDITAVKFNSSKTEIVCERAPLNLVPTLTKKDYIPNSWTNLLDTVGSFISALEKSIGVKCCTECKCQKDSKKILFVTITDGEENASKEYSRTAIQDMIKKNTDLGWTFAYLGATAEAWSEGAALGYGNSIQYNVNRTYNTFQELAVNTAAYASQASTSDPDKDFFTRNTSSSKT